MRLFLARRAEEEYRSRIRPCMKWPNAGSYRDAAPLECSGTFASVQCTMLAAALRSVGRTPGSDGIRMEPWTGSISCTRIASGSSRYGWRLGDLDLSFAEWVLDTGADALTVPPPDWVFYNRMSASLASHSGRVLASRRNVPREDPGLAPSVKADRCSTVGVRCSSRSPSSRSALRWSLVGSVRRGQWPSSCVTRGVCPRGRSASGRPAKTSGVGVPHRRLGIVARCVERYERVTRGQRSCSIAVHRVHGRHGRGGVHL